MDNQTNQNSNTQVLNRKVLLIVFGVIILAEIIWAGWVIYEMNSQTPKTTVVVPEKPTQIELQTDQTKVSVGDQFSVFINVSSSRETDGTDLIITYDPKLLSASPLTLGTLYNDYPVNKIDSALGKITVSGISTGVKGIIPNGLFGTIVFKALSSGQAAITLDFAPSSTVDTNVIEKDSGKDVLENVTNLNVTITP